VKIYGLSMVFFPSFYYVFPAASALSSPPLRQEEVKVPIGTRAFFSSSLLEDLFFESRPGSVVPPFPGRPTRGPPFCRLSPHQKRKGRWLFYYSYSREGLSSISIHPHYFPLPSRDTQPAARQEEELPFRPTVSGLHPVCMTLFLSSITFPVNCSVRPVYRFA